MFQIALRMPALTRVSRGFANVRASFALFMRRTGAAFGLLSFRPDSCLPLLELLRMSGNPLSLREKEMVMSCVQLFEKERAYRKEIHGNDPCGHTAEALGVSERTVYRVKKNQP